MSRFLVLFLTLPLAGACDILEPDVEHDRREQLEIHRARWERQGAQIYVYDFTKSCECIPGFVGPVEITVNGDVITSIVPLVQGRTVEQSQWSDFDTVQGMFALIENAIARDPDQFLVEYDPRGFPSVISIDYERQMADDEFTIHVRDLEIIAIR